MNQTEARGTKVTVPHLAESLVSATIGKWLKQPGDYVEQYEPICELITDKVTTEMPSPVEGTLTEIIVEEGVTAAVGAPICIIAESRQDQTWSEQPTNRGTEAAHTATPGNKAAGDQSMRQRYSPAVQRLAWEHGIELSLLQGTGLGGRITRKDVERAIAARQGAHIPGTTPEPNRQPNRTQPVSAPSGRDPVHGLWTDVKPSSQEVVKLPVRTTGLHLSEHPLPKIEIEGERGDRGEYFIDVTPIRHAIASRTRQSVTEIPHAWTMIEADVTNLVILRNKLKDDFKRQEGINLTYLAFVLKAVVNAIKDYPIMNSVWGVDKIIVKRDINISLLVGTEDFVVSPVIKNADQKNIAGLAREIDDLTRRGRAGKLTLEETQGGTFTVNNTGSFGSILSYPIINYPQAAILTFESIVKKPVVIQDMIAVRSMVNLCLSLDHRILDGVICGRFLQRVKENLESYNLDTQLY